MVSVTPLTDEAGLVVDSGDGKVLVVADLHIGVEYELARCGVGLPTQTNKRKQRLLKILDDVEPARLVFLGDVKHNVPWISWQEKRELPEFLEDVADVVPVTIVPGNHDGNIKKIIPEDVEVCPVRGIIVGDVGLFHGHTWPNPKLLNTKTIVLAHNHPAVRFRDELGHTTIETAWIKTKLNKEQVAKHYFKREISSKKERKKYLERYGSPLNALKELNIVVGDPKVLVMPAFNELAGGISFNATDYKDLLGPMLTSKCIHLEEAEAFLLDGTFLGKIIDLRPIGGYK